MTIRCGQRGRGRRLNSAVKEGKRIMKDQSRWEQFKREVLGGCVDEDLLDSLPQKVFLEFVLEQSDDLAHLHQAIQRKNALAQKQGQAIPAGELFEEAMAGEVIAELRMLKKQKYPA